MMRKLKLFARAAASNAVNAVSKDLHAALRRATGRGGGAQSPDVVAAYFRGCFDDYFEQLGVPPQEIGAWLQGKVVLEYGPGDMPGVALLMIAHGAERAACVDRFPWLRLSEVNRSALSLLALNMTADQRERLASCFEGEGLTGELRCDRVGYLVSDDGLSGIRGEADLVFSRSVLEHVNRLDLTLKDMAEALRPGGVMIHKVDLRSHDFDWGHPLDFLTVSPLAWRLLSSHNGSMPNRLRLSDFRALLKDEPFDDVVITPTARIEASEAEAIRPRLAAPFADRSQDDLTTLGFWLRARRWA